MSRPRREDLRQALSRQRCGSVGAHHALEWVVGEDQCTQLRPRQPLVRHLNMRLLYHVTCFAVAMLFGAKKLSPDDIFLLVLVKLEVQQEDSLLDRIQGFHQGLKNTPQTSSLISARLYSTLNNGPGVLTRMVNDVEVRIEYMQLN